MADKPNLIDLAYTKAEAKEEAREMVSGEPDAYPWGLCLTLEKRELDKLGIKELPQVGSEFHMLVIAKVTSVNQSARMQEEETRVGLQITMAQVLMVESAQEEAKEKETPAYESAETGKAMRKGAPTVMGG